VGEASARARRVATALRQVSGLFDVFKSGQYRRLEGTIEIARVNFAGRNANLADRITKRFGQLLALPIEVSLLGSVIEIEASPPRRVGICHFKPIGRAAGTIG
jgi:hypothetical protein